MAHGLCLFILWQSKTERIEAMGVQDEGEEMCGSGSAGVEADGSAEVRRRCRRESGRRRCCLRF